MAQKVPQLSASFPPVDSDINQAVATVDNEDVGENYVQDEWDEKYL